MTELEYKRLRYMATTFEATNLDGNVTVPQRFMRMLLHEIDKTKNMTIDEFTDRRESVDKDGFS